MLNKSPTAYQLIDFKPAAENSHQIRLCPLETSALIKMREER